MPLWWRQRVREAIGGVPLIVKVGRLATREEAAALLDAVAPHVDCARHDQQHRGHRARPSGRLLFDGQPRGICGEATREASLAQTGVMAELIRERNLKMRLIGVGGASTASHVRDYVAAGAHAVHLATAAMVDPGVAIAIREGL